MKQSITGAKGRGRDGGRRPRPIMRTPNVEEVEAAQTLLSISNVGYLLWGGSKKRSALASNSESSPPSNYNVPTTAEKSPSTPLCFPSSNSGSDGAGNPSLVKKTSNKRATDDMERANEMHQEKEILNKNVEVRKNLHQGLVGQNLELNVKRQKTVYSKNHQLWNNNPMKMNVDQQHYHQQITMFVPPQPQPHQHFVEDPSNKGKVVAMVNRNSNGGVRFGFFNQVDPRVNIHGKTYDFMACSSQLLDQSKYMAMENDQRVKTEAAAARRRRIMKMKEKESKTSFLVTKQSKGCG